jgi:tetratricopeptide (TPR) repeat protein
MEQDTALQEGGRAAPGGRLSQAEADCRRALGANPGDVQALRKLGVLLVRSGRGDEAIRLFLHGVSANPASAALRANLGACLRQLGRHHDAAEAIRQALELDPGSAMSWNLTGLVAHDQARFGDAVTAYRRAIALEPGFAAALVNMGCSLLALRRRAEAALALRGALRIAPDHAGALATLGLALTDMGDPELLDEAEALCRRAVARAPRLSAAWKNLGNVLRVLGRFDQALAAYRTAVELDPHRAATRRCIGQLLQESGRLDEAVRFYEEAATTLPQDAGLHADLGALEFARGHHRAAAQHFGRAVALKPDLAEAHHGLGLALQEEGQLERASECFAAALAIDPDLAAPWAALAQLQAEQGDVQKSCESARAALARRSSPAEAYWRLATNLKAALPDSDIAAMEALVLYPKLADELRAALRFGLGVVYDARRRYADAAAQFDAANALQFANRVAKGQSYDAEANSRYVDRALATFTPELVSTRRGWGDPDARPVFVLGLPRSGTTLVEQILASHSQVHGAGELHEAGRLFFDLPEWAGHPSADAFDALKLLTPDATRAAARSYLRRLDELAGAGAKRVVDKMPDNIRLLGLIPLFWPAAHVVLCSRDLRDVAVSCWQTSFRTNPWSNRWDQMAHRFADHERLVSWWRRTRPVDWLEIVYEELVEDVEGHARRLLDFLGLPWEPACLEFHKTPRAVRTASQLQVREPVYRHAVGRWRNYEFSLGPFLQALSLYGVRRGESQGAARRARAIGRPSDRLAGGDVTT